MDSYMQESCGRALYSKPRSESILSLTGWVNNHLTTDGHLEITSSPLWLLLAKDTTTFTTSSPATIVRWSVS